ncbi:MAG TPA: acyltransferase [Ohtaekwangia sp.]|uniref:acyltransferase family protein n=1 Tax=Ohtaekwangia sp. TaxID=2066019 RepID=UPI002F91E3DE
MLQFLKNLPEKLTRVTSGGKVIREIDGLRFLAIFPVVVQHLSERYERYTSTQFTPGNEFAFTHFVTNRGFIGVYIFYVISGFILGLPFASYCLYGGRKIELKSYYWRRVTRLEPPYILVMTIFAIAVVFMGFYTFRDIIPHYFASIFYLHNIIYKGWTFINPPVWTLEIEVQFYVLAPFLALLFFKPRSPAVRRALLLGFILIIMLLQQHYCILHQFTKLTILGHLQYFLIGFIFADLYLTEWKEGIRKHTVFNYIAIVSFIVMIVTWSWNHELINRIGFIVALFVLFYSVFKSTWLNRFFTLPWITAIGGMCYTIYLLHLPFIEFFVRVTKNIVVTHSFTINYLVQLLLITPFLLAVSIGFFLLIEKPCMYKDWPQRLKKSIQSRFASVKQEEA